MSCHRDDNSERRQRRQARLSESSNRFIEQLIDDRYFLLMEKLRRSALGSQLEDPTLMQQLPVLVAKLQASLHEIDSTGLYKQLSDSAHNDWLVENTPGQPDNPVVYHGDFHPNNILYANGNVTGVIDWGNVMFTHPEFDVAITYLAISIGSLNMNP